MTDPVAARTFLLSEVELLQPFDFVAVYPSGRPLHAVEVTRREDNGIEVHIRGRPRGVPELPIDARTALRERGFQGEDPADPTKPWVRESATAAQAVSLVQELLAGVFGEKSDVPIDVAHGSHRAEHESRERLGVARTRIEEVVNGVRGRAAERGAGGA